MSFACVSAKRRGLRPHTPTLDCSDADNHVSLLELYPSAERLAALLEVAQLADLMTVAYPKFHPTVAAALSP
jgi:hypothetical protein